MNNIQLIEENINPEEFDDKKLPTDVHMITFTVDGKEQVDAVRAYAMVDIFDNYYDKVKDKGKVIRIQAGFGHIRPNLYGKIKTQD